MKLVFGLDADARTYPDFPGSGEGVVNEAVVGPAGLVQILETQLGLTGPQPSEAVRVAAYLKRLRAADPATGPLFYQESLAKDAWGTARLLLRWRDELVLGGWNGEKVGAPRVDQLAAAGAAEITLPRGLADRLQALLAGLSKQPRLSLETISHLEPLTLVPLAWRKLLRALANCGVQVEPLSPAPSAASGDLARLQAFLSSGAKERFEGDGSVAFLESDTALMAAEAIAEWLASAPADQPEEVVVLCPDGDSALLDQALRSRGLPALGQSAASPWRGALQILPLAFAIAWRPFDPKPLLDLLHLPRPPIGRIAASRLAYALSREPGLGGEAWTRAWTRIEEKLKERFADHPEAEAQVSSRLARWREWTDGGLHDRVQGIAEADARAIASRVAQWAVQADAGKGDPLLLKLAGAAGALIEAIGELGESRLPGLLLDRMIADVLGDGARNPAHVAQAGALRCVQAPSSLWGPAKTVVWWSFTGPGPNLKPAPWDKQELACLARAGVALDPPEIAAERLSWSYAHAVQLAAARLIFVQPALSADQETMSHPLVHQLRPMLELGGKAVRWRAEQLLEQPQSTLAGRSLERREAITAHPPQAKAQWPTPQSLVSALADRVESPTSLKHLLECQLRWLLREVAGLSSGSVGEIPNPDQLIGNVAHELAERIFQPGALKDARQVEAEAQAQFDEVVAAIAAPLQQPEFAGELARARAQAPAALGQLATLLRERGFRVIGAELGRDADLGDGLKVRGRLDLLVEKDGSPAIVDLKWTRSAKTRLAEVREGRAIQLAAYGAMVQPEAAQVFPGGYFLLNQRRMIADAASGLSDERIEATRTAAETWDAVLEAWRAWRGLALGGSGIAMGLVATLPEPAAELALKPGKTPCQYCELTALCRVGALEA